MYSTVKKSLSSILYERTTSPFYGSLIISWLLWNWKIIYLTLFISEKTLKVDKINYITNNFTNIHHLITFPILSTLLILTILPFVSNGAFWLNLKFEKWKKDQKNQIEKKQLLSLEQSLEIRENLINQETRFEKLLQDKSIEIKQLKDIIEQNKLLKNNPTKKRTIETTDENMEFSDVLDKLKKDSKLSVQFDKILQFIQSGYQIADRSDISSKLITLLEVNDLISSKGNGTYNLTERGKEFTKEFLK